MKIIGLIAGFLGALILSIGAVMLFQIWQQVGLLCPDDPACGEARGAMAVAAVGTVAGLIMMVVGLLLRNRAS